MNDFLKKAKKVADEHDDKVDEAIGKAGDEANRRTDEKYSSQVDKGVDYAQQHTGQGKTQR
ncbi:antitoxin [Dactylosporangium sp. CA-139066]|uniref:antitoxin n=1 Tax=Dactylosporangium sp. CA-139066 TaxID=3239930 RepID=UPI003D92D957